VATFRVFHRRFEAYHHPRQPQGRHVDSGQGGDVGRRADAEAVAGALNERDRQPEYGELGHADWVVVED
jgi:hypothetical protein